MKIESRRRQTNSHAPVAVLLKRPAAQITKAADAAPARADAPNLPYPRRIAQALGELREQLVFVGGAVAGLLPTDPTGPTVCATRDVDAVVNASPGHVPSHRGTGGRARFRA